MEKLRKFPKYPENIPQRCFYATGPFRIDPAKRLLLLDGAPVPLTSKDFELLMALIEHRGEVQIKEELMRRVWPDTIVEEGNLNRHISTLRKILGESPNQHEYIVTVPGRGYQFVAEVDILWHREEDEGGPVSESAGPKTESERTNGPRNVRSSSPAAELFSTGGLRLAASARPLGVAERPNWRAVALIAGVIVFVVALSGGFWIRLRAKPILTNADQILIADFVNSTGDPVFDDTLKQGIAVQLEQSPAINVLSEARIRSALRLMTKPSDTRLTPDLARDVCQREGARAYIAGSIASLGSKFVLGVSAVDCATGDTLAREQATAADKEHVLNALSGAASQIRMRLGESRSSVQRFDIPLTQATTSSLEALQAFSAGNLARDRKGDAAAVPLYKRAIELDPIFTMAYDALGLAYSNLDEPKLATENIAKAFELRERGSEHEKFQITANFSQMVTGDLEKVNQICEPWTQLYPRDSYPHNLLGVNYEFLGQYDKALVEMREAARLNPEGAILHSDIMEDYTALNDLEAAKKEYEQTLEKKLDHPYLHADRYGIAFLENDSEERNRQLLWATGRAGAEDFLLSLESDTQAYSGKLADARELSRRAIESARAGGQNETAALWQANAALREAEFGNADSARKQAEAALVLAPSRDVQVLASLAIARSGNSNRSQEIAEELAKNYPRNTVINDYWLPTIRAAIAIDRGDGAKALKALRAATPYELGYPNPQAGVGRYLYPVYVRAQAYLLTHRYEQAALEYQKILEHPSLTVNTALGVLARLGLARARARQSDVKNARSEYGQFLALWKGADSNIPILDQAKTEYSSLP